MQIDEVMALVDEYVSASIEDHGYRSGAASAEYLEDTKRKLLAAIESLIAAPAAPQQSEPVAQIGWADEFGNLFPMGAWKPAQRTHHDSHKAAWRPVFLHPPAAEVQQAEPVGDFQRSAPGKIWMNLGNDGMDEIEYPTWDALVRADENITWSEDRIDATDIPYVRADLAHPPAAEVQRLRDAARDVCEWADAAQWALGNETGVPAAKLDALRRVLEGGE